MYKKLQFKKYADGRGDLVPLEFGRDFQNADIPFDVQRCYFIGNPTNDVIRGKHAHKNLEQVIVVAHGSFTLDLDDGHGNKESLSLSDRVSGIYIKNLIWRELRDFSENCVIIVFASQHYDPDDYIHDYNEFLNVANKA